MLVQELIGKFLYYIEHVLIIISSSHKSQTTIRSSSSISSANTLAAMWSRSESRQKRQQKESPSSMAASTLVANSISCSLSYSKRWKSASSLPPSMQQMTLIGTKHDPHATEGMDVAIVDFIFSNGLPISLVDCAKFHKLIQSARHIPPKYHLVWATLKTIASSNILDL